MEIDAGKLADLEESKRKLEATLEIPPTVRAKKKRGKKYEGTGDVRASGYWQQHAMEEIMVPVT